MNGEPPVVAQWVRTSWTKRSRGGPAATRRNASPHGFVLPELALPLVHEVRIDERDDFQPHHRTLRKQPKSGEVVLRLRDALLDVQLVASMWGMPRRSWRPPPIRLAVGGWVRWQINYRFVDCCTGA